LWEVKTSSSKPSRSVHWMLQKAARLNAGIVLPSLSESQQEQQQLVHQELAKSSCKKCQYCSAWEVLVHLAVCSSIIWERASCVKLVSILKLNPKKQFIVNIFRHVFGNKVLQCLY
jgi:hypothetical protein